MRLLTAFILGTVFAASPAYPAPIPKEEKKSNAELLVGKWELTGGTNEAPKDLTLIVEFSRGGKMTLTLEPKGGGGDKTTLTGKYKVEKDKIDYELEQPDGEKKKEILTISKLTDTELVTVDPDNIKEEFKRVKAKKTDGEKK